MSWQVPCYIFYPIIPLPCFSNEQVFIELKRRQIEIDKMKKTRAIAMKKVEEDDEEE